MKLLKEKELEYIQIKKNHLMVNGRERKKMGIGNIYIQMMISIKVSIKVIVQKTLEKEMEFIHFQMRQFMQFNLKIIKLMVKENTYIKKKNI